MANENQQYKQVGTDANGMPLYQKVEAEPTTGETKVQPMASESGKYQAHDPEPHYREDRAINGYLYDNIAPEVIELRHQRSVEQFPNIKFHDQEFVMLTIRKHPLELALIWAVAIVMMIVIAVIGMMATNFITSSGPASFSTGIELSGGRVLLFLIFIALIVLVIIFAAIGTVIHRSNYLVLTTEKLVQYVMFGLFNNKIQTVDLNGVEDVSSMKTGLLQSILNIGVLKMSTVGDESTYTINFIADPVTKAEMVNEVVQAVKNERPLPSLADY